MKMPNFMLHRFITSVLSIFILVILLGCSRESINHNQRVESLLPSLYITIPPDQLDSILVDKNLKFFAQAILVSAEKDTLYDGMLKHIKTRGNSTFAKDKKPFAIKFPKKQSLLGLDKSNSFVLLANAMDDSHIRNAIAFDLAHLLGLPAPKYTYLSLYFNDEYKGLYQMTNRVEVSKHMLNAVMPRGYLLELVQKNNKKTGSGFVTSNGEYIKIRWPEDASTEELEYIE